MSTDPLLERTRQADLQPLLVQGVPVFQNVGEIRVELERALSLEHFELFADPNPDAVTGDIQWYAPFPGEKIRLADCSEDDREQYEFYLARLVDDIAGHAGKLEQSGDDNSRAMAQLLLTALEIPDESHIFVIDGRPVLSGWGHVPRGPARRHEILIAKAKRTMALHAPPPPPPPPTPPVSPPSPPLANNAAGAGVADPTGVTPGAQLLQTASGRRHALVPVDYAVVAPLRASWLNPVLWGILTLLLIGIGHLLLQYCALVWPSAATEGRVILNYCEAPRVAAAPPPVGRNNDLLAELRTLEASLAERRSQCTPPRPPVPPVKRDTTTDLLKKEGGQVGAVNVILTWNTEDDLDLHILCPNSERIYYSDRTKCGGELDVDRNGGSRPKTAQPIENVFWSAPMRGTYKVEVDPFSVTGTIDYKVELRINGQKKEEYSRSTTRGGGKTQVFEFTIPYVDRPR